jgi:cell wall-associated NlpC family hydrolase
MLDDNSPQPGDFAVVSVDGPAGFAIRLGEWLNGRGFDQYEHAFVYVGDGRVVQAEPDGAADRSRTGHRLTIWSTGIADLSDEQRVRVVAAAVHYLGTPYSFLDYLALFLRRLHVPFPGLRGYIASTGHMICSQLVDQCYRDAGVELFSDGRWPGYVTPADLAGLLMRKAMKRP